MIEGKDSKQKHKLKSTKRTEKENEAFTLFQYFDKGSICSVSTLPLVTSHFNMHP